MLLLVNNIFIKLVSFKKVRNSKYVSITITILTLSEHTIYQPIIYAYPIETLAETLTNTTVTVCEHNTTRNGTKLVICC